MKISEENPSTLNDQLKADNPDLTIKFDFQGSQDLVTSLDQGNSADAPMF